MGTLRCSNVGHGLTDVADLVRHSVDRPIPVCIRRVDSVNNGLIELMLTPKKWPPGVGLLGCVLLPFDSIDRWIHSFIQISFDLFVPPCKMHFIKFNWMKQNRRKNVYFFWKSQQMFVLWERADFLRRFDRFSSQFVCLQGPSAFHLQFPVILTRHVDATHFTAKDVLAHILHLLRLRLKIQNE